MIQSLPKLLTFDEFIEWLPESRRYELHEGTIIEMQPTGKHEEITGFLTQELTLEYTRMNLPCSQIKYNFYIMPYLDIVFHNIQHGGNRINKSTSRTNYTATFVAGMNAFQSIGGSGNTSKGSPSPSATWGPSVTGANTACGIFFCESNDYTHGDYTNYWQGGPGNASAIPVFPGTAAVPGSAINSGYTPWVTANTRCVFLEGNPDTGAATMALLPPVAASPHWVGSGTQALRCLGTGAAPLLNGLAPPGNDRYGILFQAAYRTYATSGGSITGVFVHTQNNIYADPGTQIAALCKRFPAAIIFGDLNLDLEAGLKYESLSEAVAGTHRILAIQHYNTGNYYSTRYNNSGAGTGCLDYALVPNAETADVTLWAEGINKLTRNGSDHAYMMLRIHCN